MMASNTPTAPTETESEQDFVHQLAIEVRRRELIRAILSITDVAADERHQPE